MSIVFLSNVVAVAVTLSTATRESIREKLLHGIFRHILWRLGGRWCFDWGYKESVDLKRFNAFNDGEKMASEFQNELSIKCISELS